MAWFFVFFCFFVLIGKKKLENISKNFQWIKGQILIFECQSWVSALRVRTSSASELLLIANRCDKVYKSILFLFFFKELIYSFYFHIKIICLIYLKCGIALAIELSTSPMAAAHKLILILFIIIFSCFFLSNLIENILNFLFLLILPCLA